MNENQENVVVKTKTGKGIIVLLVILILMVIGLSTFIVYDKIISKDNLTEEKSNDEEQKYKTPEKNSKYKYEYEKVTKIKLNNKEHTLLTYYYTEESDKEYSSEGTKLYNPLYSYKEVYFDNKKILDATLYGIGDRTIQNDYRAEDNVKYISDTKNEKQYLIYRYEDTSQMKNQTELLDYRYDNKILIIDENGNVLESLSNIAASHLYANIKLDKNELSLFEGRNIKKETDVDGEQYLLYNDMYWNLYDAYENKIYYIGINWDEVKDCINLSSKKFTEYRLEITDGKVIKKENYIFNEKNFNFIGGC